MLALCIHNVRHIIRSRFLFLFVFFSSLLHFAGLKLIHTFTVVVEGVVQVVGPREGVFISLYFQLFAGVFLAAVYGIWMIPYLHTGNRAPLTFTLPISKWKFAVSYAVTFFALIVLEQCIMVGSIGVVFGSQAYMGPKFPWTGLMSCIGLEVLAFEVTVFAFAASSLIFGQIPTFFFGVISYFILQTTGLVFRSGLEKYLDTGTGSWKTVAEVYRLMPPIGEIIFDLRQGFVKSFSEYGHFYLWAAWFAIFFVVFKLKLDHPSNTRVAET